MTWSWTRVILAPLSVGSVLFGEKTPPKAVSNQLETDWTIHADYFEAKILNEQLKEELSSLR